MELSGSFLIFQETETLKNLLYFRKWNFLALILKKALYFLKRIHFQNRSLENTFLKLLSQNFFHKNTFSKLLPQKYITKLLSQKKTFSKNPFSKLFPKKYFFKIYRFITFFRTKPLLFIKQSPVQIISANISSIRFPRMNPSSATKICNVFFNWNKY